MAWNEPGGNDNDPWGNRKNNSGGPPDLDDVFKNLKKQLNGLFGNKGGSGSNGSGNNAGGGFSGSSLGGKGAAALAVLAFILWLGTGLYIVEPAQSGVVTRFGAHTVTQGPGWHWHLPWPIEDVEKINVEQVRTAKMTQQLTLTQDENLVQITVSVQYNVKNAEDYLFRVQGPDETLDSIVESAVREAIGQTNMESILTTNSAITVGDADTPAAPVEDSDALQSQTFETVQRILDSYRTGLIVTAVNLEEAQPPDEVQAAFSDAIKAREDKERIISEAEAYANEILPRARGDAARITEEAEGYKTRVVQSSVGESQRFLSLLTEYEKAPKVTQERLYIEAMESVLSNTSKVLNDGGDGNSLMYLPLDQLMKQSASGSGTPSSTAGATTYNSTSSDQTRFTDISRDAAEQLRDAARSRERGSLR